MDLRDTLAEQVNAAPEIGEVTTEPPETPEVPTEPVERPRDATGKFVAKDAAPQVPEPATAGAVPPPAVTPAAAAPRKPPSSWKKDYWDDYGKLDPRIQDYIEQREQEALNGISTYKQQAEAAREVQQALAPYLPDLQASGVQPAQWISSVAQTHRALLNGAPQDKVNLLSQLAANYGVPARLAVQGQNGQWQLLDAPTRQQSQQDINAVVDQAITMRELSSKVQAMMADTVNYPHFQAVSQTMYGLLQSGLAPDLDSAYKHAVRLNDELWQQDQQSRAQEAEKQRQAAEAARVAKARAAAVSPKSATPSANMTTAGKKGLHATLSDAYDAHAGGRV